MRTLTTHTFTQNELKRWSDIHKQAKAKVLELEKQQQVPMLPVQLSDSGVDSGYSGAEEYDD